MYSISMLRKPTDTIHIEEGMEYVTDNSDLCMHVVKVHNQCDKNISFYGVLKNKRNNLIYEVKEHSILKNQISHWRLRHENDSTVSN